MDFSRFAAGLQGGALALVHADHHRVPAGRGSAHAHGALEIAYHRRGAGVTVFADGRATPFAEHSIEIYPAGLCHRQDMTAEGVDHFVHLQGPATWSAADLPYCFIPTLGDGDLRRELVELTRRPAADCALERAARDHLATALVLRLLALADAPRPAPTTAAERHAHAARRCIAERFASLAGIADIARAVGIGEDRLRHAFAGTFGRSLLHELTLVRLEHARALLRAGGVGVAEAGRRCGFADPGYFSRVYRRWLGVAPGADRNVQV